MKRIIFLLFITILLTTVISCGDSEAADSPLTDNGTESGGNVLNSQTDKDNTLPETEIHTTSDKEITPPAIKDPEPQNTTTKKDEPVTTAEIKTAPAGDLPTRVTTAAPGTVGIAPKITTNNNAVQPPKVTVPAPVTTQEQSTVNAAGSVPVPVQPILDGDISFAAFKCVLNGQDDYKNTAVAVTTLAALEQFTSDNYGYNDDFFGEKSLIALNTYEASGSITQRIVSVFLNNENNTPSIDILLQSSALSVEMTDDIGVHSYLIEIDKKYDSYPINIIRNKVNIPANAGKSPEAVETAYTFNYNLSYNKFNQAYDNKFSVPRFNYNTDAANKINAKIESWIYDQNNLHIRKFASALREQTDYDSFAQLSYTYNYRKIDGVAYILLFNENGVLNKSNGTNVEAFYYDTKNDRELSLEKYLATGGVTFNTLLGELNGGLYHSLLSSDYSLAHIFSRADIKAVTIPISGSCNVYLKSDSKTTAMVTTPMVKNGDWIASVTTDDAGFFSGIAIGHVNYAENGRSWYYNNYSSDKPYTIKWVPYSQIAAISYFNGNMESFFVVDLTTGSIIYNCDIPVNDLLAWHGISDGSFSYNDFKCAFVLNSSEGSADTLLLNIGYSYVYRGSTYSGYLAFSGETGLVTRVTESGSAVTSSWTAAQEYDADKRVYNGVKFIDSSGLVKTFRGYESYEPFGLTYNSDKQLVAVSRLSAYSAGESPETVYEINIFDLFSGDVINHRFAYNTAQLLALYSENSYDPNDYKHISWIDLGWIRGNMLSVRIYLYTENADPARTITLNATLTVINGEIIFNRA